MNTVKPTAPWRSLKNWLPVLVWAGLIFVFSTETLSDSNTAGVIGPLLREAFPSLSGDDLDLIRLLLRKLAHFGEYFILAVLIMRALRDQSNRHRVGLAIAFTTLYAVGDEFHQSMVPSRTSSAMDVLIDVCGGICGAWWSRLRPRGRKIP